MKHGAVAAIAYSLPENVVTTQDLANEFPEWAVEKIDRNTGIRERHIAEKDEYASDLTVEASRELLDSGVCHPSAIDRLGLPTTTGAYDFNLGCSGYIYGLGQAEGLIATGQASNVLLITADTYSKFIHPGDKSVRTIFGDGAAATLVRATESDSPRIGPFVYGSNGSGAKNLIVPAGGLRLPCSEQTAVTTEDDHGNVRSSDNLFMAGGEIFNFTLSCAPSSVDRLLEKAGLNLDAIDLFVFHQTNTYTLNHLRKKTNIPEEKFVISMSHCGNTVSSSIPIALNDAMDGGRVPSGALIMLVGFGVGYSWGATLVRAL